MTNVSVYAALKKKYWDFSAPTIRIKVDGKDITQANANPIASLTVDLTSSFDASGCSFDVIHLYEPKNTAFSSKSAFTQLQLGAAIEVEIGYIETEMVFYGLVSEVEYIFDGESAPYIHVECIDAKALLMKQKKVEIISEKSISQSITDMLSEQPFSQYIKGKTIDATSEKKEMIPAATESDYEFITRYASYIGYEFFIIQGKVYFRKQPASASSIMDLTPDTGIKKFKASFSGNTLYNKVEVVGINPQDNKMIKGEATVSGTFSKGSTAKKMMSGTVKTYFDSTVQSAAQAGERANVLLGEAKSRFGRVHCECMGLPELVPGRSVKVKGFMPEAEKACYLLNVRHVLDDRGFRTIFEGRIDSL